MDNKIAGAKFSTVDYELPYYNTLITVDDTKPWMPDAMEAEKTFLNVMKAQNEPVVKDYKELKLEPIDYPYHEAFTVEDNRPLQPFTSKPDSYSYLFKFMVLFIILFVVYKLMR